MYIDEYVQKIADALPDTIPHQVRKAIGRVVLEKSECEDGADDAWMIEDWVWGPGEWWMCCEHRLDPTDVACDNCGRMKGTKHAE